MKSLVEIRRDLHRIPEIGFQEDKTQKYLLAIIEELKKSYFQVDLWKTGIILTIHGSKPSFKIGWRADIDGLPIEENTGLPYESTHHGYMHACGHDFHMAIALGLVKAFSEQQPINTTIIYFQPAEEGPGGAKPMLEWMQRERKDLLPDYLFALHIAPEYPVGTIATRSGLLFANTSELFIDLHGVGGHAAFPQHTKDMTVAAANLIMQLQTIVSRNLNPLDSGVITIGKMVSGYVQNSIAEDARLEGTIRTMSAESMLLMKERIEALCKSIEIAYDCEVSIDYGSSYYQVYNEDNCAKMLLETAEKVAGTTPYECPPAMTGEDFGFFLKEIPGAMFWTGANSPYGLHHASLQPDETLLDINVRFVEQFLRDFKKR
ncbi:N-acetyldiaminopimelate deacetylase [Rummeliibacillus stabekisii]|uniref:N-acetyldiaminopimelate deacetylase n=1 Tax=Rummeliibacillus stabekisii TaxID=241244 RepID=UPI00203FAF20|nr:N-acetyldiaminopimelate deacetylase [Rummeliibacillus stabekisii]MCM3315652.1 N-acetyldiaminopimelate deacetylase [Rummeliibacillus stabekisii]